MAEKSRGGHPMLLHGRYELGLMLGHGTLGKVYHAGNLLTGNSVVGKEKVIKVGMVEQVKREISVMKMVKHPNIVELHEVMASKSKIYFAMELVPGGELFSRIAKGRLREDIARVYFQQLISAIDFCHSRGVYRRDRKPENLLLDEDGNLKVTDFGLSAFSEHLKQDGLLRTICGTPAYFAPEVTGRKGLITKLLDPNPSTRIPVAKIMDSSWFKKSVPKTVLTKDEMEFDAFNGEENRSGDKSKQPETLNAFHIISLSEGFDLSPLFEEKRRGEKEELRFATTRLASCVISRLEEVAKAGRFSLKKSDTKVKLQVQESGRKGKLATGAEIFPVMLSFLVVEAKKDNGDTLEYNQFCSKELRPALKAIFWTSPAGNPTLG